MANTIPVSVSARQNLQSFFGQAAKTWVFDLPAGATVLELKEKIAQTQECNKLAVTVDELRAVVIPGAKVLKDVDQLADVRNVHVVLTDDGFKRISERKRPPNPPTPPTPISSSSSSSDEFE